MERKKTYHVNVPITSHFAVPISELYFHVCHTRRCPHSARVTPQQETVTRLRLLMCEDIKAFGFHNSYVLGVPNDRRGNLPHCHKCDLHRF